MVSVAEIKKRIQNEREAEERAEKLKYEKDLPKYRDKIKEVKPKLMKCIERCIYNDIKYNISNIRLYKRPFEEMFKPINKYGTNILVLLANPEYEAKDAYDVALKELAEEVRKELFNSGVKRIVKNSNCFVGEPYLFLEI